MSRTIRRKNQTTKRHHYWCDEMWYTHDYITEGYEEIRRGNWGNLPLRSFTGKAFRKGWWKFHSDKLPTHVDFRLTWYQVRAKNKNDLDRWYKDENHECVFHEWTNKKDWD